jgi:small subunit ribosomal protein S4
MGKPKFSRKKYETPSHPWQEDRIKLENELIKKYGLKNKKEIWRAETRLKKYRTQARELLAKVGTGDPQISKESNQLLVHLDRVNILPPNSTLDDVLALETESILSRRLQTLTYLKGLANTPTHARQLISHGHIAIGTRRVTVPSYMVTREEEGDISYTSDSPLNDTMHPARPKADFRSMPITKTPKPEEPEKPKTEEPKEGTPKPEKPEEKPPQKPPREEKTKEEIPKSEEKTKEETAKSEEKPSKEPPAEEKPKEEIPKPEKPEEKPAEVKAKEKEIPKEEPTKKVDETSEKTKEEKPNKKESGKKTKEENRGDS